MSKKKRVGAARHPIASKIIKRIGLYTKAKVIDLRAFRAAKENAAALQETVATQEELADFHPTHAIYAYVQNQLSVLSEQITLLKEMDPLVEPIMKAEDDYLPSGPPMSPMTVSFFSCWAFFDLYAGRARETIATTIVAVGRTFGMHQSQIDIIETMQRSRMGIYIHEGLEGDKVVLRELVTGEVHRTIVPSGHFGARGELWYVRLLPPLLPDQPAHLAFTTPYVLLQPLAQWQAYFERTLPDAPPEQRVAQYEAHMKHGPSRTYWPDFVFEAYASHRTEVIFLEGLPDVAESRPHA